MTTDKHASEAEQNADVSVDDADMDSGASIVEEAAVRYRDPVTKRFAKRPSEEAANEAADIPGPHESARDRIAKQFQELRKQNLDEDNDEPIPMPRQLKTGMTDEEVAEQAELTRAEQAEAKASEAETKEPEAKGPVPLTVVVDGQLFQVDRNDPRWALPAGATDEQARASAQIFLAAEARLARANQLLDQVKAGQPPADQSGRAPSPTPNEAPGAQTTGIDQEKIGEIVDRLQYGNRDEAAEALLELTRLTSSQQQGQAPDIQAEINRAIVERDNQKEIERAVSSFEKNNSDLTGNRHLQQVVLDVAVETMVEDMRAIGVPDEILGPIMGKGRIIAAAYRNMRNEGFPLKTHEEVLEKAGEKVRATFNMPRARRVSEADKPTIEKRVEQKRNMQQQPRSAGVRQAPAQAPRPLTRSEVIQQAKRQRMPWAT